MQAQENTGSASRTCSQPEGVSPGDEIQREYWRRYYSIELQNWIGRHAQSLSVPSGGIALHVDLYERPERNAPVIVFNHGGGGYSRMFAVLAWELYNSGYTVALPDQRGQGYSAGNRGDFTIPELVENICDAFTVLRDRFAGPMILAGASFGGALTYMAAAELVRRSRRAVPLTSGASVAPLTDPKARLVPDAVVCHNLYDLGRPRDALGLSRLHPLRNIPGFAAMNQRLLRAFARILPMLRLPFRLLGDFRAMVDERDAAFYDIWKNDPVPLRRVSLRYLSSVGSSPPAIDFEDNQLPVLVINPTRDRMTPPEITRKNYERLGGPKLYRELPYGHWSVAAGFAREWRGLLDQFVRSPAMVTRYSSRS